MFCKGLAMSASELPQSFADEAALDEFMSRPTPDLIASLGRISGDLVLLGIGGKLGVTMGMLAVRALRAAGSRARRSGRGCAGSCGWRRPARCR